MSMDCNDSFECTPEMEEFLCERLLDQSQPISERFRALFSIRNLKGHRPRESLLRATRDPSYLLAHEAVFALGQMQDSEAIPPLEDILKDLSFHPIVRHEAAEALGAIGSDEAVTVLKDTLIEDPILEVQETCELALRRIMEQKNINNDDGTSTKISPFNTIDPAIPSSLDSSVDQLSSLQ